jgi:hypothetical protein
MSLPSWNVVELSVKTSAALAAAAAPGTVISAIAAANKWRLAFIVISQFGGRQFLPRVACDQAGSTAAFIADAPQRIPLPRRNRNLHAFDRNDLQELGA